LVPFAGFLAPTRGLRMSEKASRRLTAVSVLVVAGWVDPASALTLAGALVLPIVVILAVDELIVRRGRLELEGLYRAPSPYGALFGIGVAAPIATVLGWLSLLGRWDGLSFKGILAPADQLSALAAGEGIEVVILSSVVVALVYAVFRTVERALPQWPSPRRPAPGPERLESAPSSIQVPAFESEPRPADALPTGPLDPTVVEAAAAAFNESALKGDDKWPDERDDGSEANWFDGASDVSNPSITELGDPHFVKKRDDEA
ncbi:MAG: cytosine permease, partial [Myxococcota bacterium]